MKSSIVYGAVTLRIFVRFETGIWPSTELKKSLDIFWPRLSERKRSEVLVILLVVKESFERYSCLEFNLKNSNHCEAWNVSLLSVRFYSLTAFSEILHSQFKSSWIKMSFEVYHWIIFLVFIVCQDLFLIALPLVVQFQLYINIACRST